MRAQRRRRLSAALSPLLLCAVLTACSGDEPRPGRSPTAAALGCGSEDIGGDVISSLKVEVLEQDRAHATFVLSRDAEVGILISRHEGTRLRFVGRVPFGPQRSTVVNEQTFELPNTEGPPVAGEYEFTLRAFEAGKLNQGDPVDTRSACIDVQ